MEAPEKIYLSKNIYSTFVYQTPDPEDETEAEYTRTDVFIERACEYISQHQCEYIDLDGFKNYMREE